MDAKERANKILKLVRDWDMGLNRGNPLKQITSQIEEAIASSVADMKSAIAEAVREAVREAKLECESFHSTNEEEFLLGFSSAREQAVGIAEKCFDNDQPGFRLIGKGVSDNIRAMSPDK